MEQLYIKEIQGEYKKIDKKWLYLHFKTSVGLVIFTFIVECFMGVFLYKIGQIHTTIPHYILKYLVAPVALNIIFIAINYKTLHIDRLSQNIKIYITALTFVMICFLIFSVHIIFSALYFIFAIPILLTIIYGNYKLTSITAITSIASVTISELFIKWDSEKLSIFENDTRMAEFVVSLSILVAFSAVCMVVIHFEKEKNVASIQKEMERYKLKQKIQTDELTGINNRTALRNALNEMEEDLENSYIFAMIDLDNFKKLNDNLGHITGDQCLIKFGEVLKENCQDAVPFRYGGDEFCVLFKNYTISSVMDTCKKIQQGYKAVDIGEKIDFGLTASFGIAKYTNKTNATKLLIDTDKALYESKVKKDTICIYKGEE